jgi:hypothetical protein
MRKFRFVNVRRQPVTRAEEQAWAHWEWAVQHSTAPYEEQHAEYKLCMLYWTLGDYIRNHKWYAPWLKPQLFAEAERTWHK